MYGSREVHMGLIEDKTEFVAGTRLIPRELSTENFTSSQFSLCQSVKNAQRNLLTSNFFHNFVSQIASRDLRGQTKLLCCLHSCCIGCSESFGK